MSHDTHWGGPSRAQPAPFVYLRAREYNICSRSSLLCCFFFENDGSPVERTINDSERRQRRLLFLCVCFSPLMTCRTNQPPPPAFLPYRVLGSAHNHHVHTSPLLYIATHARTHAHTFAVSALPIQTTDSGGSERERGVSRAASLLTPPQPCLSQCRSYVICIRVHLAIWSVVCVCVCVCVIYNRS